MEFAPGAGLVLGRGSSTYKTYGALYALGTEAAPITFTSNEADPAPGDWKGINFHYRTVSASTFLEHCVIEYGGRTNANVYVNATPTIRDCTIQYSGAHGIYLYNSSPSIKGNVIKDNTQTGIFLTRSANPVIGAESAGNVITGNGTYGISADDGDPLPTIEYNTISHNGSYPVQVGAAIKASNNTFEGNGVQAIYLYPEYITVDTTWSDDIPVYIVSGDVTVRGPRNSNAAKLTIEPGVTVKFSTGSGLTVGAAKTSTNSSYWGILSARGTEAAPITFTSNAADPSPGDWKGIYFHYRTRGADTFLEHCFVEYGGRSTANVHVRADATIHNCVIQYSGAHGVYVFLRNLNNGVYNDGGTSSVNAANNWWGDPAGPGHGGDSVSGVVNVTPWLTAESGCIAAPPLNDAPYPPRVLGPEDNAVDVPATAGGQPVNLSLEWAGGDPNPFDAVSYDLYFGDSEYSLARLAGDLVEKSRLMAGLAEGRTYFWQVVAKDDMGEEIVGPVWRFTTLSSDPDHTPPAASGCDGPRSGAGPGNRTCD